MSELLVGCGSSPREKRISFRGREQWTGLVTLDMNPDHKPDVVWDLTNRPLPFDDDTFDEIHAYDVLEHLAQQGDWRSFFAEFTEWWRILRRGGVLVGSSPAALSPWAWGDPGHTRIISRECFTYLNQTAYDEQVGKTRVTDYRFVYQADFNLIHSRVHEGDYLYALQAIKPSRCTKVANGEA